MSSDTVLYGISSILSQLASLVLVPFYTKELSPSDYGIIATVSMFLAFLKPISSLGMDGALFRYFSLSDQRKVKVKYYSLAVNVKTAAVIGTLVLLGFTHKIWNKYLFDMQVSYSLYLIILATFFFENLSALSIVPLRADRKVKVVALVNVISLIFSLALSVYLVLILHLGVVGVFSAGLFSAILTSSLYLLFSSKWYRMSNWSKETLDDLLSYALPIIPHKIQGQIVGLFVIFMINTQMGIAAAGLYSVAKKFSKPVSMLVQMVQQAWVPYKFQLHKNHDNPASIFNQLISFYWILLISLWFLVSIYSPYIFEWLIDPRYFEGISYIPFIIFYSLVQGFAYTAITGFELRKSQKPLAKASFWGMILVVCLSLLLKGYYEPYSYIIIQVMGLILMVVLIYPKAKEMIQLDLPFYRISLVMAFASIVLWYSYRNNLLWLTNIIVFAYLILVGFTSLFLFPSIKVLILSKFNRINAR